MWKWLTDEWAAAKAAVANTWAHVKPVLAADSEQFAEALFQIAIGAVTKQIPLLISGGEKFSAAVTDVIATAETQAIAVAKPMAQKAVQDAYVAALAANGGVLAAKIPSDPTAAAAVTTAIAAAEQPITKMPDALPTS